LRDDRFVGSVLLFDGADLLNGRDWRVLLRAANRAAGLIVTSHQPCRLSTVIQCRTSPELLRRIVAQLLPDVPEEVESLLPALCVRHKGNLRAALRELYDLCAKDIFISSGNLATRKRVQLTGAVPQFL
jgi:hypothetical protein